MRVVDKLNSSEVSVCSIKEIITLCVTGSAVANVRGEIKHIINTTRYNSERCLPTEIETVDFSDLNQAVITCTEILKAEEIRSRQLAREWRKSR